jgi:hypothetical protein
LLLHWSKMFVIQASLMLWHEMILTQAYLLLWYNMFLIQASLHTVDLIRVKEINLVPDRILLQGNFESVVHVGESYDETQKQLIVTTNI